MDNQDEQFCAYVEHFYEGVYPPHFHRSIVMGAAASAAWYRAIYPSLWEKFLADKTYDRLTK